MNDAGTLLYATGLNATHCLNVRGDTLDLALPPRFDLKGSSVECVRDSNLFVQQLKTNNLNHLDSQLTLLEKLDGNFDHGGSQEDFHNFRHSADEVYLLWRKGKDELGIVDVEEF